MGLAGAGKSTYARRFVDEGYLRLNRDEAGGSLRGLFQYRDAGEFFASGQVTRA